MEGQEKYQRIVEKLQNGMSFGLFENGSKCYFEDGEKVGYHDLWKALRIVHELPDGAHHKTLPGLCPDTFVGTFMCKFSKHNWKKKSSAK